MTALDQPRFEEKVRSAAAGELNGYLARNTALAGSRVLVQILVRTVIPLSPNGIAAIRESLEEVGDGRASHQVRFEVTAGLHGGYEIQCEPITNVGARADLPPADRAQPAGRDRLLTVSYGALRFDYLIAPGTEWWPLTRPADRHGGAGFQLPQSMASVPTGVLVELRLDGDTLLVRRPWTRPEVGVVVHDIQLDPRYHHGVEIPSRGRIAYQYSTGQWICVLDYELRDWAPATPSKAGSPDTGDGGCHVVWLNVDSQTYALRIAPPLPEDRAVARKFPIPAATRTGRPRYLDAQVLYTTGTWCNPGLDEWHVKVYRCATQQHAEQLRRYLRTQASQVDKVNAAAGGTGLAPPWVIAPVTVLPPGSGFHGDPRVTEMHVLEREVSADPENRLSAWFGVPDQPQPNCFVIVVSPMLKKVGWASSTLWANAPGVDQLPDLMTLAAGLDRCHGLGIAHCDVKPANVCRNVRGGKGSGYILIDGDAVCRRWERLIDLRLTHTYASPRIVDQWRRSFDGTTEADLREHDRFGFALVVLAAVAGSERVAALLREDERGERPVDTPDVVTSAIARYWPQRWSEFAGALAGPFQPNALVGDEWSAEGWLKWLIQLREPPPETPPEDDRVPRFAGVHRRHLDAIRAEVQASPHALNAWVPAVVERVAAHQHTVARMAYARTVLGLGLLPLLVVVLLLIAAVTTR